MASIQIPGIGSVEVPDFATDYTLQQVLNVLSSQEAERVGALGEINQTLASEVNIARAALAKDNSIESNTGRMSRMQNVQNKITQQTLSHMKSQHKQMLTETKKHSGLWTSKLPQVMRAAGSMISGKGISDALSMMPGGMGQGIALATKVVGEFADSQRRLTDVGFGLGTSILNTTEAISSFRVPLSELERIASTNGVTLDYLNDATGLTIENMKKWSEVGVKQGTVAFGQLSKNVRDSMEQFGNMGFTVTEVNSFLAEYLETDRKRGVQADISVSNLTDNFHKLALETAAYAMDTGRNRKDLMKAQLENLNRTDASTYAMMLRMKGDEKQAQIFEDNLSKITLHMKSSYGDNADEMIDAWIQAQVSGRGIEATDAGAEVLAMLGPFGTQLDALARKTGRITDGELERLNDGLKEGVNQYQAHNLAVLATTHSSLQYGTGMLQHFRQTTAESRAKAAERLKDKDSGSTLLKANEAVVDITTKLQQGLLKVTNKLVGDKGTLSPALESAIKSVGQFSDAIGYLAEGQVGKAAGEIKDMLADNPWQVLAMATAAGTGVLSNNVMAPAGYASGGSKTMARGIAMQNIAGASVDSAGKVTQGGQNIGRIGDGSKFTHGGVEYKYDAAKKSFEPTKGGIKAITGGRATGMMRGVAGSTLSGVFTAMMAVKEGYDRITARNEQFDERTKGMDKSSARYIELEGFRDSDIKEIGKDVLLKGGGGVIGTAIMGGIMGTLGAGPVGTILGTILGGYLGWEGGAMLSEWLSGTGDPGGRESVAQAATKRGNELQEQYQLEKNQETAKTDPIYLELVAIKKILQLEGQYSEAIANASAVTATTIARKDTGLPGVVS